MHHITLALSALTVGVLPLAAQSSQENAPAAPVAARNVEAIQESRVPVLADIPIITELFSAPATADVGAQAAAPIVHAASPAAPVARTTTLAPAQSAQDETEQLRRRVRELEAKIEQFMQNQEAAEPRSGSLRSSKRLHFKTPSKGSVSASTPAAQPRLDWNIGGLGLDDEGIEMEAEAIQVVLEDGSLKELHGDRGVVIRTVTRNAGVPEVRVWTTNPEEHSVEAEHFLFSAPPSEEDSEESEEVEVHEEAHTHGGWFSMGVSPHDAKLHHWDMADFDLDELEFEFDDMGDWPDENFASEEGEFLIRFEDGNMELFEVGEDGEHEVITESDGKHVIRMRAHSPQPPVTVNRFRTVAPRSLDPRAPRKVVTEPHEARAEWTELLEEMHHEIRALRDVVGEIRSELNTLKARPNSSRSLRRDS